MPERPPRAVLILAGGSSSRFGSDKTRATVRGVTLLEHAVAAVEGLVDEVLVVGPWAPVGIRQVVEPHPGRGPLGALAFGLTELRASEALVLAADHPQLVPALLELVIGGLEAEGPLVHAAVAERGGGPEPLVAAYRRSVVPVARSLLAEDRRSMRSLLDELNVRWIAETEWRAVDPSGQSFRDVDRRTDLDATRTDSGPERDE